MLEWWRRLRTRGDVTDVPYRHSRFSDYPSSQVISDAGRLQRKLAKTKHLEGRTTFEFEQ